MIIAYHFRCAFLRGCTADEEGAVWPLCTLKYSMDGKKRKIGKDKMTDICVFVHTECGLGETAEYIRDFCKIWNPF